MRFKMNSLEKKWVLYDVGNSAFTLLVTTIMPIYFNALAESDGISDVDYLAYWGYATSISTLIVALLGPTMGTVSDFKGMRKWIFSVSLLIGALGCVALGFIQSWLWFLILFVIAKSAYSLSLVVYDSMLPDVTTNERMDEISSRGYAWGYIGSCIPFLLSLMLVLFYEKIGLSMALAMGLAFLLTAVWWVLMSLPLLKIYEQTHYQPKTEHTIKNSFIRLKKIFSELKSNKKAGALGSAGGRSNLDAVRGGYTKIHFTRTAGLPFLIRAAQTTSANQAPVSVISCCQRNV